MISSTSSICEHCERSFPTEQGLKNHQSRTDSNHVACHRAQQNREKVEARKKFREIDGKISSVKLVCGTDLPDVSLGPHKQGSPINSSEKKCILNLFQSYINDGMNSRQARIETATRLQFSENSISKVVREKIATGYVTDNSKIRIEKNAFEKLADEEVETLRKLVSKSVLTTIAIYITVWMFEKFS